MKMQTTKPSHGAQQVSGDGEPLLPQSLCVWINTLDDDERKEIPKQVFSLICDLWDGVGNDPDELRRAAEHPHYFVRMAVATNLVTPPDVLDRLVNEEVCKDWVVNNPSTATATLSRLANDSHPAIRRLATAALKKRGDLK